MEKEVIAVIDKIRPYIQRDGGDIEFVSVDDQGVVKVRMLGACVGCGLIDITLKDGLEALLLDEVPGVTEVVLDLEEDLF
ncbi:MAG: NifU family protein [Erysipelotrichaceae bacterium]|nr:NifU family protein [Erysipelotrichaceae bacterium]